ncbi:HAMP domain-containing protein [Aggregicoccus sp. 17bor-14]|uniref:HAMP domain-containing protein n=1 Tax=Myxococcaceae TaxID=31 RepID=UPI00129CCA50|nr:MULTISPECIES: HAMP domain-containing protein [Myxococcaceae]MRI90467.1 HAMP domain-containing protein [Aggregicoccus sp. 17bor-14]
MPPTATLVTPPPGAVNRRLRNYLLEPRFQLKFTSYIVLSSLVLSVLLGAFLVHTTRVLMQETESAVEARSRAAEASRSVSTATLNNELLARMDDPAFEAQLKAKSQAIDAAYEAERSAIVQQRAELVHRQRLTWVVLAGCLLGFIVFVALATIVATHRIVGPLMRIRRIVQAVADGQLQGHLHALRERDELKETFESVSRMVQRLRERQEEDVLELSRALAQAEAGGLAAGALGELRALEARMRHRLDDGDSRAAFAPAPGAAAAGRGVSSRRG